MSMPLVSIVIPTFNREKFLPATFASVLSQDYPTKEIVVVDDGSSDATAEVCARHPVRYVRQEHGGGSAARNTGARNSAGELLVFLDDDDLLAAGSLAKRVGHWLREPQYDLLLGKLRRFVEETPGEFDFIDAENARQFLVLGAALVTRRGFEKAGGFNEGVHMGCGEDVDLWLRMRESGHLMKFIDDLCLLYRRHRGNSTWNRDQTRRGFMSVLRMAMQRRRREQMEARPL